MTGKRRGVFSPKTVYDGGMRRFLILLILFCLPLSAPLADDAPPRRLQLQLQSQAEMPSLENDPLSKLGGAMTGEVPQKYIPPKEPVFEKVVYMKIDPPGNLGERVDRLLHGIRVDVPPAYDHYGYEIRRYMAAIAGPQILGSPENLEAQLKNINNAKIIVRYWRQAVKAEIDGIEEQIDAEDASSSVRSIFKFNRGAVEAFFVELESWMNTNRAALEVLLKMGPDRYSYEDPVLAFRNYEDLAYYASLHKAREAALRHMRAYTPFRMMIY